MQKRATACAIALQINFIQSTEEEETRYGELDLVAS